MVVTTISCDALILRCPSCGDERAIASEAGHDERCQACGTVMQLERSCDASFLLRKDGILVRCIAENRDGWRCEDRGGRDFCPDHAPLADPYRNRPTREGPFLDGTSQHR